MKKPDFTEQQLSAIRRWLVELQGPMDQGKFAADVLAVTGWSIERSRVSKYGNGTAPLGREVFEHFADYARLTDRSVPDLSAADIPAPDLATSVGALAAELREWRTADRDRIAGLETLTGSLAAQLQRAEARLTLLERRAPQETAG